MMNVVKSVAAFATVLGCAGMLGACGSSSTDGGQADADVSGETHQTTATSTPNNDKPTNDKTGRHDRGGKGKGVTKRAKGTCTTAHLKVTVGQKDSAAGSTYYKIRLKNIGRKACHLNGHPGVSAVSGGKGKQVGKSAEQGKPAAHRVNLDSGDSATATLKAVNIGSDGGPLGGRCDVTSADGWRIYPPDSRKAVFVKQKGLNACSLKVNWLTVGSVTK